MIKRISFRIFCCLCVLMTLIFLFSSSVVSFAMYENDIETVEIKSNYLTSSVSDVLGVLNGNNENNGQETISETEGVSNFSDVSPNDYFFDAVNIMYGKKAIYGYTDGTFRPRNNITVAESLMILYRMLGIEISHNSLNTVWYGDVFNEAIKMGVISKNVDPNSYATRNDIANYIISLYRIDITKTTTSNVFVDTNTLVANTMYEKGIFVGAPAANGVVFNGDSNITRGDLCLVLYRIEEKISNPYNEMLIIGDYVVQSNPVNYSDLIYVVKALGESENMTVSIPYYRNLNDTAFLNDLKTNLKSAFEYCFSVYPENFSFTTSLDIRVESNSYGEGKIYLYLSNPNYSKDALLNMRKQFYDSCNSTIQMMLSRGDLDKTMTETQKAQILFEYVAKTTKYDTGFNPASFTGFGAAIDGEAVCQGYTALYNQLCKLVGIQALGQTGIVQKTGESHMWTKIKLDDTWWYCDVTFSDPIPDRENYCDLNYFMMTYEEIMQDRVLDSYLEVLEII